METIYEVHFLNRSKKPTVTAHYDLDDAKAEAIKTSKGAGKATLLTVTQDDETETETEIAEVIYVKGEPQGEATLNKVRSNNMEDANLELDPRSGAGGEADAALKAQKAQEREAKKAEKEAAKALKAEERAAKKAERDAAKAARGEIKKGPRNKFDDEAIINFTETGRDNPKRAGSKAHGWYAGYVDGMSVKDYREVVGKGQANACIDWDEKHRFITVSGGNSEA